MSTTAGANFSDRRLAPVFAALLGLTALMCQPAAAADPLRDVYTVSGVPVDATAASSQLARDQAVAGGESRAMRLLMERLALRRDYPRLPQVAPVDLANMVDAFSVSNERTSAVRYLADLTVTFRPDAVRALMAQAGIPIAETPSRPVLVLPVWRGPQGLKLFDETNPWREAWIRIATGKGLVPLTTPLGDVADLAAISADQAASGNQTALAAIAQRYGMSEVIVAVASGDARGETIDQLVVTRYVIGGQRFTVNVTPRRPPEALLATALAISQEVEEAWKASIAGSAPQVQAPGTWPQNGAAPPPADSGGGTPTMTVRVPVSQLSEWLAIRKRLSDVPLVKKVDVSSLGVDGAVIVLSYVGGEQQLQATLAQSDLMLSDDGGTWVLRARPGATLSSPPPGAQPVPSAGTMPPPSFQPPSAPSAMTPATPPPAAFTPTAPSR